MAVPDPADPRRAHAHVDPGPLWAGGVATAVVAALIAVVGVLIGDGVLDLDLVEPPMLGVSDSYTMNYAITAAILALFATGLAHLLALTTPDPRRFFSWIVWLATAAAVAEPFTEDGETTGQIAVAVINLVIGMAIYALITATIARATTFHTARDVRNGAAGEAPGQPGQPGQPFPGDPQGGYGQAGYGDGGYGRPQS